jgi:hypothetical protein
MWVIAGGERAPGTVAPSKGARERRMKNREKMVTELLAIRARVDDMIGELRAEAENDTEPKPERTYMKIDEFCARWSISRRTIYARIAEGLPVDGDGHARRIHVKTADEWMKRRTGRKAS